MSRRRSSGAAAPDRGAATVWAAGVIVALVALAAAVWLLGGAVVARRHAVNAADLAALAAAGHATEGTRAACAAAGELAGRMEVRLRECRLEQWDALVIVEGAAPGLLDRFGPVVARARAGPVEAPPRQEGV